VEVSSLDADDSRYKYFGIMEIKPQEEIETHDFQIRVVYYPFLPMRYWSSNAITTAKECILRATCLCSCSKNVSSLEMINGKGFLGFFLLLFFKGW